MRKSQVNRARIAERAGAKPLAPTGTIGTNPALRITTPVEPGGNVGRQWYAHNKGGSGVKGYGSEWSRPTDAPYGGWQ
jgi:hypothetical protein